MPRPAPGQPTGYDLVNTSHDGERRTVARFVCFKCSANMLDLSVQTGARLNPSLLVQRAERRGWSADPVRRARVVCPDCKGSHGSTDVDAELHKFEAKMAIPAPVLMEQSSAAVVPVRDPTADQRAEIRRLLEAHFDEGLGAYLGEYSDQRIAEETNVPRVVVERLRDAAYGPIRMSAAMVAARKELDELKAKASALQDDALQWMQSFCDELDKLRARVSEVRASIEAD